MPHQPCSTSSRISLLLFLSDFHGCGHVLVHMWFFSAHSKMNPFLSSIKHFSDATKGRFKPYHQFSADVPSFLSIHSLMLLLTVSDWILGHNFHRLYSNVDACESESHSAVSDSLRPHELYNLEFSRPEYWSEYPFPSPGDLPNPRIEWSNPCLPQWGQILY